MKYLKALGITAATLIGLAFVVMLMEAMSITPRYELEPATVRKVVPDEKGYIGTDWMTYVKFDDGFATVLGGDLGEPGERILAHRHRGARSMFGIIATP